MKSLSWLKRHWPSLESLDLSFNRLPVSALCSLRVLRCLRVLDLSGNSLSQLPDDLSFLESLEKLSLAHNSLSSASAACNPNKLFVSLATLPRLSKLSLAHNKLAGLHLDDLLMLDRYHGQKGVMLALVKLDLSFNRIEGQERLMQALHFSSLNVLKIIGNPLVVNSKPMTMMGH